MFFVVCGPLSMLQSWVDLQSAMITPKNLQTTAPLVIQQICQNKRMHQFPCPHLPQSNSTSNHFLPISIHFNCQQQTHFHRYIPRSNFLYIYIPRSNFYYFNLSFHRVSPTGTPTIHPFQDIYFLFLILVYLQLLHATQSTVHLPR